MHEYLRKYFEKSKKIRILFIRNMRPLIIREAPSDLPPALDRGRVGRVLMLISLPEATDLICAYIIKTVTTAPDPTRLNSTQLTMPMIFYTP